MALPILLLRGVRLSRERRILILSVFSSSIVTSLLSIVHVVFTVWHPHKNLQTITAQLQVSWKYCIYARSPLFRDCRLPHLWLFVICWSLSRISIMFLEVKTWNAPRIQTCPGQSTSLRWWALAIIVVQVARQCMSIRKPWAYKRKRQRVTDHDTKSLFVAMGTWKRRLSPSLLAVFQFRNLIWNCSSIRIDFHSMIVDRTLTSIVGQRRAQTPTILCSTYVALLLVC